MSSAGADSDSSAGVFSSAGDSEVSLSLVLEVSVSSVPPQAERVRAEATATAAAYFFMGRISLQSLRGVLVGAEPLVCNGIRAHPQPGLVWLGIFLRDGDVRAVPTGRAVGRDGRAGAGLGVAVGVG